MSVHDPARADLDRLLRLPPEYRSRQRPEYFADSESSELIWQPDVYGMVGVVARRTGATVVDFGCGTARKLLRLGASVPVIGIDYGPNIAACRAAAPDQTWIEADLERIEVSFAEQLPEGPLVAVSCDVIEHLVDPRPLLRFLAAIRSRCVAIVVSTPERIGTHGAEHHGPPPNPAHVREWSLAEFRELLTDHGLPPGALGTTRANVASIDATTITAVVTSLVPTSTERATTVDEAGRWSPCFPSVEAHLARAAATGFDLVAVTDPRSLVLDPSAADTEILLDGAPTVFVRCCDGEGDRVFPFNLLGPVPADRLHLVSAAASRHLPIALAGVDEAATTWARASLVWYRRREQGLLADLALAADVEHDLRRMLADSERATTDVRHSLEAKLDDLRTIERDLRRSSAAIEADLRRGLEETGEKLASTREALETTTRERERLRSVVEERRRLLTIEAEHRARTMPDVDRSNLAVPAPYAPRRVGAAASRRLAPRFAAFLHRAAALPRLGRLHRAADDVTRVAAPAHDVPGWLFDASYYLRMFPPAAASGISAVAHYDLVGWRLGRSPHPLFAAGWYLGNHPDVRAAGVDPLRHFVEVGWALGYDPHPLFSISWYLDQGPDVAAAAMNPLAHYLQFGWQEGRDPHPLFDTDHYLEIRPDVAAAGVNPLAHYVEHGWRERTPPSRVFDPRYYELTTPASTASTLPQYWYFLEVGAYCGDSANELAGRVVANRADHPNPDQAG